METSWDNPARFNAIFSVIDRLPHDQAPMGMGFKLIHNPATCIRCKAQIALLEMNAIINILSGKEEEGEINDDQTGDPDSGHIRTSSRGSRMVS